MKSTSLSQSLLAILGYGILVLASIIFLVIIVEFDPEGHLAKKPENYVEGILRRTEEGYELETASGSRMPMLRTDKPRVPEDTMLIAYTIPGTNNAIPEYALPHVPRSLNDLLIVIGVLLVSMILVAADPRIAYFDIFHND